MAMVGWCQQPHSGIQQKRRAHSRRRLAATGVASVWQSSILMTCAAAAPTRIHSLLRDRVACAPPLNAIVPLDAMPMNFGAAGH